jgi:hypothetical protein
MTQYSYDGEPRDYSQPVTAQDVLQLSQRLSAAGIEAGHGNDVTERLLQPGHEVIGDGEEAHVIHRPEPPLVHFAVGNMAIGAPAADIQHTVVSGEPAGLIALGGNQAWFNQVPAEAEQVPGVPSADTEGARLQQYKGREAWLVFDTIAHYVHAIERAA